MTMASRDQKLYDALIDLKRHMRSCQPCVAAKKSRDPSMMCNQGLSLTGKAAFSYDDVIRLKVAAHNHPGHTIYACPDLTKHGKVYQLTATAFLVTAAQDALF